VKKVFLAPLALMVVLCSASLELKAVDSSDSNVAVVPEPASIVMMGAGLAGVAYLGWKRNKKK